MKRTELIARLTMAGYRVSKADSMGNLDIGGKDKRPVRLCENNTSYRLDVPLDHAITLSRSVVALARILEVA